MSITGFSCNMSGLFKIDDIIQSYDSTDVVYLHYS